MLRASCHCGAVTIQVPRRPRSLTECNCSICRRYGTRWAYYEARTVKVMAARGATDSYAWGDHSISFVRCATCGTVTHWQQTQHPNRGRMGVNACNFEPAELGPVRVRRLDGADTWKFLD